MKVLPLAYLYSPRIISIEQNHFFNVNISLTTTFSRTDLLKGRNLVLDKTSFAFSPQNTSSHWQA